MFVILFYLLAVRVLTSFLLCITGDLLQTKLIFCKCTVVIFVLYLYFTNMILATPVDIYRRSFASPTNWYISVVCLYDL
jgi:hypothetical protein